MPTLSIVIPAFNEELRLGKTLAALDAAVRTHVFGDIQIDRIIVADDGSSDRTSEIALSLGTSLPIQTVRLPTNRGKGAATRAGMQKITGDYALIYDADSATPIEEIPVLLAQLLATSSDIAIGSRVKKGEQALVTMSWHRRLIGRLYRMVCAGLVPGIADAACGCKLFRSSVARELFSAQRIDRFAYDVEVLAMAIRRGYKIVEVPVSWTAVPRSKVRIFRDGTQMFFSVLLLYWRKIRNDL